MIGSIAFNTIPGIIADAAGSYIPAYWIVTAITLVSLAAGGSRLYPLQQKSIIEGKWNMQSFTYTITEPVGIHARPAGLLVKEIKNYQSTVTVTKGDKSVNALKLMALMGMGIKCGDTVTVTVEGSDEDTTAPALKQFFETNL